jgi:hypothetical protein
VSLTLNGAKKVDNQRDASLTDPGVSSGKWWRSLREDEDLSCYFAIVKRSETEEGNLLITMTYEGKGER